MSLGRGYYLGRRAPKGVTTLLRSTALRPRSPTLPRNMPSMCFHCLSRSCFRIAVSNPLVGLEARCQPKCQQTLAWTLRWPRPPSVGRLDSQGLTRGDVVGDLKIEALNPALDSIIGFGPGTVSFKVMTRHLTFRRPSFGMPRLCRNGGALEQPQSLPAKYSESHAGSTTAGNILDIPLVHYLLYRRDTSPVRRL